MAAWRPGTSEVATRTPAPPVLARGHRERERLVAGLSVLGGLAASSCCVLPLILFGLGISGAWIANLTALALYKPLFVAGTAALLGYGFFLVYWKARRACAEGEACRRPRPHRVVRLALWVATVLVAAAFAFDYAAPVLLGA